MALRVLVGVTLSLGETEGRSVVAAIYGCQHKICPTQDHGALKSQLN
jgi:hypothetical protein